jgi:hypothetical protein
MVSFWKVVIAARNRRGITPALIWSPFTEENGTPGSRTLGKTYAVKNGWMEVQQMSFQPADPYYEKRVRASFARQP